MNREEGYGVWRYLLLLYGGVGQVYKLVRPGGGVVRVRLRREATESLLPRTRSECEVSRALEHFWGAGKERGRERERRRGYSIG